MVTRYAWEIDYKEITKVLIAAQSNPIKNPNNIMDHNITVWKAWRSSTSTKRVFPGVPLRLCWTLLPALCSVACLW
ncbi:unnamed protein product [Urochloa humidicola]